MLIEGVPGVAKTLAVETLATAVGGTFARLQFTPDLVPADIIGTRIYKAGQDAFDVELGPVFANFVLTDEINRAPAKVQSALLEVMAERQVSIGGVTHPLPDPFLVLATQNPIESEGVYPLPEAQRDRFLMKVLVDYPTPEEEREIVYRMGSEPPVAETVLGPDELRRLQKTASQVFVHHALVDYVVRLVVATRTPREHGMEDVATWVSYGASPRASLGLIAASRALALVRGRDYVLPQDILDVTADVLRHRLVLSYDALADGVPADHIVKRIVQTVPLPQVAPRQNAGGFGPGTPGGPHVPHVCGGPAPAPAGPAADGRPAVRPAGVQRLRPRAAVGVIRRRRQAESLQPGPEHPGLLLHPATPGSGIEPGAGDGAPPRFADGPADVLLRRLELTVRRRLDGLLQGDHLGLVPGSGSEAGDSRTYHPGDDVRRMDWPVTARTQVPHIRETIADRELETWAVVDLSASLDFGTAACQKRDLAIAGLAAVGHLTVHGGNRLGAVVTTGERIDRYPAMPGRLAAERLLRSVVATPRAVGRAPGGSGRRAGDAAPPGPPSRAWSWSSPTSSATATGSGRCAGSPPGTSCWPSRWSTRASWSWSTSGLLTVVDPESGQTLEVPTGDAEFRARFAHGAAAQREEIATALRRAGAGHLQLQHRPRLADGRRPIRRRTPSRRQRRCVAMTFQAPLWLLALLGVAALVGVLRAGAAAPEGVRRPVHQRRAAGLDHAQAPGLAPAPGLRGASRSGWPRWWCPSPSRAPWCGCRGRRRPW